VTVTESNEMNLTATRCGVCNHPDRAVFDAGMLAGTLSQADVARAVGCNKSTVSRHVKSHLLPAARDIVRADPALQVDILGEVRALIGTMKQHAEQASSEGNNWQAIRAFHSELRAELELLAKLLLVIAPTDDARLVQSREWVELRGLLLSTLRLFPEALEAVIVAIEAANA